ncbi:hypothetical protein [Vibrio sp. NTOU-M3]|uniref:hypothetical protein n=1 Tax=unclassified Vibrio TaxID=2614977 RepID=UPI00349F66D2
MKKLFFILILGLTTASAVFASAQGGRSMGPEVKCELPNGNVQMIPKDYCMILSGKEK